MGFLQSIFSSRGPKCKPIYSIDLEAVYTLIDSVIMGLNDYMETVPEVVIEKDEKNLFVDEERQRIVATYPLFLGAYYLALLEVYYYGDSVSEHFIEALCRRYPFFTESEKARFHETAIESGKKPVDFDKFAILTTTMQKDKAVRWIRSNIRRYAPDTMVKELAQVVLSNNFNQKCSDYNTALLTESFKEIVKLCCKE